MRRFEQDLYELFTNRMDAVVELENKDPKYLEANKERSGILSQIEALVGRELVLKFDEVDSRLAAIEVDYIYKQGFHDGMKLEQMIKGVIPESAYDNYEE